MSTSELVPTGTTAIDRGVLPTNEVVARMHRIQEVMRAVMKEGTHYGTIPGTPKPTLYKPGAEKLLVTFKIAAAPSNIEDLSTPDEVRYRVTVRGTNQVTGEIVGEMVGECSSGEEKYKWRKPVCDEEWAETDPAYRREKWQKGSNGAYKIKQVRTSPPDVANTILKMATKRALIALTLVALGASDIFAQDLEDLAEELRESIGGTEAPVTPAKQPQRKSQTGNGTTTSKPAGNLPDNAQFVTGVIDKVFRSKKNTNIFIVKLRGSDRMYSNWADKHGQVEKDAAVFQGTDHTVKLAYVQSGDFFNVYGVSIADAEPVAQVASHEEAMDPKGYNPFEREPGSDG